MFYQRSPPAAAELANFIESSPLEFSIEKPCNPTCGSAGCIGGFAAVLWPEVSAGSSWNSTALAEKLGISRREEHTLCFCYPDAVRVGRSDAIAVLRYLAETGEIDWKIGREAGNA